MAPTLQSSGTRKCESPATDRLGAAFDCYTRPSRKTYSGNLPTMSQQANPGVDDSPRRPTPSWRPSPRRSALISACIISISRAPSPTPTCWRRRDPHRKRARQHRIGIAGDSQRDRRGSIRVACDVRGRAHEHRKPARGADRRHRQEAAYRPLTQRPGRDRHASVSARRDRHAAQHRNRTAGRDSRSGRKARRYRHARLHPSADGSTHHLRPSPAGMVRDAAARSGTPR